ncbi:sigma-54-dependent Fis family transcriptional regulator [Hoeflea sp. TYP-13]|uniref:sigma-54-dependent Fis family transcriptional regulator n=1 Tax=Hoeflea sp. TYP-13 TaxID=3230023 RepID=UPI0034C6B57A
MSGTKETRHIDEVVGVVSGRSSKRDLAIQQSWQRCVDTFGLDPTKAKEAVILPDSQVREHQERKDHLIRRARFGLENLYRQVSRQNYVVLLTDESAVTVDYIGDPTFSNQLKKAGLYLGSNWDERLAGTCGVGVCATTGEALTVHQTDHFDTTHVPLTCTSAPIYNAGGKLSAVLDISALQSPSDKGSQYMALALVKETAKKIEMAGLCEQFRSNWIIRFNRSPELLEVDPDCAIAVDDGGRLLGMTHNAQRFLAETLNRDWRQPDELLGVNISEYFDCDVDDLVHLTRATPADQRAIVSRMGAVLFADATKPEPKTTGRNPVANKILSAVSNVTDGDPAMQSVVDKAMRLADSPIALLLLGETGTGKEFLARSLHNARLAPGPFVAVDCAALPEEMIERELFGSANQLADRDGPTEGYFQKADGGTLFLDEVGELDLAIQTKFLRVLSEKEFTPVGGGDPVPLNFRLICSTNRELRNQVTSGQFRGDLYYRINGAELRLPRLSHREDFRWLGRRLLKQAGLNDVSISQNAWIELERHIWPGNIRELANVLEYSAALCTDGVIQPSDLPEYMFERQGDGGASAPDSAYDVLPGSEAAKLQSALRDNGWNISATARALQVDRTTIHRRIKRLNLVIPYRR